jgi:hypothetical protein
MAAGPKIVARELAVDLLAAGSSLHDAAEVAKRTVHALSYAPAADRLDTHLWEAAYHSAIALRSACDRGDPETAGHIRRSLYDLLIGIAEAAPDATAETMAGRGETVGLATRGA